MLPDALHRSFVNDKSDAQTEKTVNLTHPLGVTLCKIIVYGDNMHTLTGKCIKISRESSNESFTLTCLHLGNSALMKNDTADKLYLKVFHSEYTPACLTAYGKSIRKNVIKSFSVCKSFLKDRSLSCEFLIVHILILGLKVKNFVDCFAEFLYLFFE